MIPTSCLITIININFINNQNINQYNIWMNKLPITKHWQYHSHLNSTLNFIMYIFNTMTKQSCNDVHAHALDRLELYLIGFIFHPIFMVPSGPVPSGPFMTMHSNHVCENKCTSNHNKTISTISIINQHKYIDISYNINIFSPKQNINKIRLKRSEIHSPLTPAASSIKIGKQLNHEISSFVLTYNMQFSF